MDSKNELQMARLPFPLYQMEYKSKISRLEVAVHQCKMELDWNSL